MEIINIEENIEIYNPDLRNETTYISSIIREIASNDILLPQIKRSFIWKKNTLKDFIIFLYRGIPLNQMIFWRVNKTNLDKINKITQLDENILSKTNKLPEFINLVLGGIQECIAISRIFLRKEGLNDEIFQPIDLYYNFIKDEFKYKDEIQFLDNTWINLKDIYSPFGNNSKLMEDFEKKIDYIYDKLKYEDRHTIYKRVERIFRLMNKEAKVLVYDGDNVNFILDFMKVNPIYKDK